MIVKYKYTHRTHARCTHGPDMEAWARIADYTFVDSDFHSTLPPAPTPALPPALPAGPTGGMGGGGSVLSALQLASARAMAYGGRQAGRGSSGGGGGSSVARRLLHTGGSSESAATHTTSRRHLEHQLASAQTVRLPQEYVSMRGKQT